MPNGGMKLYLMEHNHTDEVCPGRTEDGLRMMADIFMGKEHAQRANVVVLGSYVPVGTHRVLEVLATDNIRNAEQYAELFKKLGPTTISEVIRSDTVVHEGIKEYKH